MMKKICSLIVLALVMVASYFVGCNASDGENIQAPSKSMARYKAQEVVKETLPIIQAFVDAQYNYALGKDSVPQWDQYLANPDPNLKQRIDRAVYLRKGRDKLLSYSGYFELVEYSKIVFEKDRWVLDNVVLQYKLPKGNPDQPNLQAGGMNYSFSIKKDTKGEWKILAWTDDNNIVPGPAWDYQPLDKIQASLAPKVDRASSVSSVSSRNPSWYDRYMAIESPLWHWNSQRLGFGVVWNLFGFP